MINKFRATIIDDRIECIKKNGKTDKTNISMQKYSILLYLIFFRFIFIFTSFLYFFVYIFNIRFFLTISFNNRLTNYRHYSTKIAPSWGYYILVVFLPFHFFLNNSQSFTKSLEMNYFSLS